MDELKHLRGCTGQFPVHPLEVSDAIIRSLGVAGGTGEKKSG